MIQKKWILIGVIAVIVIVSGVAAYSFIGALPEIFSPPVDVSGIHISSELESAEIFPDQMNNAILNPVNLMGGAAGGFGYMVRTTEYDYNGITLRVWKAQNESEATNAFEGYYDDPFDFLYYGSKQKTKTPAWFTFEGDQVSGFAWKSGVWIFAVEAENAEIRNQATAEWVQELRNK